jgi:hypothetical protein
MADADVSNKTSRSLRKKAWLVAIFVFLFGIALSVVGWWSNSHCREQCRTSTAFWLYQDYLGSRPFYIVADRSDDDLQDMFLNAGVKVAGNVNHDDPWAYPRLYVGTRSNIPFVVEVDYFWERGALIGGGGTKRFLCLFGRIGELEETNRFAT